MLGDQLALAWVVKSHLPSAFGKFSKHEAFTVKLMEHLFSSCLVLFIIGPHLRVLDSFMVYPWMLRYNTFLAFKGLNMSKFLFFFM